MRSSKIQKKGESPSIFQIIKEALVGSHRDYTEGPLEQAILILAIPMVLEMVMEGVFAVVDIFFVGRLGAHAVATVGLTESLLTMIYTLSMGLGIGATAVVARRVGAHDRKGAVSAAVQSLLLALICSIMLGIVGFYFASDLLFFMGASPEVLAHGVPYARLMLGGNLVILMLFLANAIVRGAGDGAIAMRSLWLANGINIGLGPCLIFGLGPFPELGLMGAAVATTIGRGTGALYVLSRILLGSSRIQIRFSDFRFKWDVMKAILRVSTSGIFQNFIGMASWMGLMRIVSTFGSTAVAGYTIGIRLILLILLPAMGVGNAAATLVGQSLGAQNPQRAEKAVWISVYYNVWFMTALGAVLFVLAKPIVGLYTNETDVARCAVECIRVLTLSFPFFACGMVLTSSFNGAGDSWTPTVVNFAAFWLGELPIAYALAHHFGFGPLGVFLGVMAGTLILAVLSLLIFRQGKWKMQKV